MDKDFLNDLIREKPVFQDIISLQETFWINPKREKFASCKQNLLFCEKDVLDASACLSRFRSYIASTFPETVPLEGIIESPVREIPRMRKVLLERYGKTVPEKLFIKLDSHLAVSGSIKARGGIYEVLRFAEKTAVKHKLLKPDDDYSVLLSRDCRELFSRYSIVVGSTGNLGLSVGIMGARLGFKVIVHMSVDARTWKKDVLRGKGVEVVEHQADYSEAVAAGRALAESDPFCHFIDDENSRDLFLGYSVAAERLKLQLAEQGIVVDRETPLFVYLPCGVGGGPGGITYGLKLQFGDDVHCFFGEPAAAPAMLVGLASGLYNGISAKELGLDGKTDADGLAVSRPSGLVARTMEPLLSGLYTVTDEEMYRQLALLYRSEEIALEPSALLGFSGVVHIARFTEELQLTEKQLKGGTHLVWATGGSMVPEEVWKQYELKGASLLP